VVAGWFVENHGVLTIALYGSGDEVDGETRGAVAEDERGFGHLRSSG